MTDAERKRRETEKEEQEKEMKKLVEQKQKEAAEKALLEKKEKDEKQVHWYDTIRYNTGGDLLFIWKPKFAFRLVARIIY